jgi:hypothetical protein
VMRSTFKELVSNLRNVYTLACDSFWGEIK